MKFSLKAAFAALTIFSLLALVYQEKLKVQRSEERLTELGNRTASYERFLQADLPYLRRSTEPDLNLEALHSQAVAHHQSLNLAFAKSGSKPDTVSVFHVPALRSVWKSLFIQIPETTQAELQIFVSTDAFGGRIGTALNQSTFGLLHPVQIELPAGLSSLSIRQDGGNASGNAAGDNADWKFELNGVTICTVDSAQSGFTGENLIWLLSKKNMLFGHENVYRRARYDCQLDENYLEFAGFQSTDYFRKIDRGLTSARPEYLKCALSFQNRAGHDE